MEQKQIDALFQEKRTEEIIGILEDVLNEQEEEYAMLKLAQAYLMASDEKNAKKMTRRIKLLFPSGKYFEEENELLEAIKEGTAEAYLQKYVYQAYQTCQTYQTYQTETPQAEGMLMEEEGIPEDESIPEESIAENESIPEESIPEESIPEESIPEESIPEESIPEESIPEESIPEEKMIPEEGSIPEGSIREEIIRGEKIIQEKKAVQEPHIPESIAEYFKDVAGMKRVQTELSTYYNLLRLQNDREEKNFSSMLVKPHFMICGERGSGKSLLADIIAHLLYDFAIRDTEEPVYVAARDVLRAYLGNNNQGDAQKENGIDDLFAGISDATVVIENMEDLVFSDDCTESMMKDIFAALEQILTRRKDEISVIFTGSSLAIKKIKSINPTIQDRMNLLEIPSYSTMELVEIAEKEARKNAFCLHEDCKKALIQKIDAERSSDEFMNALSVNRYLEEAIMRMADRYCEKDETTEKDMVYLMPEDFQIELEKEESIEEILAELDALVGLQTVKEQVKTRIKSVSVDAMALKAGAARKGGHGSLHLLFTGNPGTGKTTVARMLGKVYRSIGILPRGNHVVECTRSDLVGQYQGHTAKLVQAKFQEAAGGVLFIDEAYALCRGDGDTFGQEAVDEIIAYMENNRDSVMVILAGYKKEMEEFLNTNPGFRSRIPETNYIQFEDYSVEEMVDIFRGMVKGKQMVLGQNTKEALRGMIEVKSRTPNFGNARGVRNLFEEVLESMNTRIYNLKALGENVARNQFDIITKEDIEAAAGRKLESEKTVEDLLEELDGLTGLSAVKEKVREMVNNIKFQELMKKRGLPVEEDYGTLHLIFKGNAGTGKTTVARLLGKIYNKLGVLKKSTFVEVSRAGLVAGYLGQTALKVMKKVEEADGGILFIDEAYTLVNGEEDSFGMEALNTLVAEVENRRKTLMVILAGYGDKMDELLDMNQGLQSRFSHEVIFEDYSEEELAEILQYMLEQKNLVLEDGALQDAKLLIREKRRKVKDFGNARGVRNIMNDIVNSRNSRIMDEQAGREELLSEEELLTIRRSDIGVAGGQEEEETLEQLLEKLNGLTGMAGVKEKIQEMVNRIRIQNIMQEQGMATDDGHGTLHLIFKGNAGTGKTTVARLLGKIYNRLGVLKRDTFVEVSRSNLVAAYQGQTALQVIKKIEEADGGILFIDEAYTLINGEQDTFGAEAIHTLVAELENRRNSLMVIVAGYADKMDEFLRVNQGLASRLSHEIIFEDYSDEELMEIFLYILKEKKLILEEGGLDTAKTLIAEKRKGVEDFGNARGVRNLVEDMEKKKDSRLVKLLDGKKAIAPEDFRTITIEDILALRK